LSSVFDEKIGSALEEKKDSRLPSGIPGFDDILGDGFPNASLYILSGPYGGHHLTFAQQVLYNHMVSKGNVAYYTIENSSEDIMDDMAIFNWHINKYVDDGSWKFIRLLPPAIEKVARLTDEAPMEERISLKSSLVPLQDDFLSRLKEGRWSALNFSYITQNYPLDNVVELLLYMLAAIRKYGGIHFLFLTEGLTDAKTANTVKDLIDGVFEFENTERAIEYGTTLHIRKMRKTVLTTRTVKITLMPSGMVAETASRI
jgi:KaiC/GvpD/RAD55 family RecA-like ATPase